MNKTITRTIRGLLTGFTVAGLLGLAALPATSFADETCASPYMKKITGQEDYVYVWTLGEEGIGDEQDKLVTVDVNPCLLYTSPSPRD